jgi:DNA-binding NtrC family response regulator
MADARVLIVDDEMAMLENCCRLLSREGYVCDTLSQPVDFRDRLAVTQPDVVLLDLRMPEIDGMTLLTVALADDPTLPVIIMTAYATVSSAVQAIREGAFDYLTKPFRGEELLIAVERAIRHRELAKENKALRERMARGADRERLVGSSPVMVRLMERMEKVAAADANVLITGESGTGKELIARTIHELSERKRHRFVPVDCAALPEGLLESELFGHERGAFTSADARKIGLLEDGNHGTVFLDEIAELSQPLQSKLLRVLEERRVRRVGGNELIEVNIRVIAATNQELDQAVAAGRFREDLYYRLNVVPIQVPPLRDRAGDIALLAQGFLARFSAAQTKEAPRVSPDVWDLLERYDWPGNVRELKNLVERLVVLDEDGLVSLAHLPESLRPPVRLSRPRAVTAAESYEEAREAALRAFKADYVAQLLDANDGNVSKAARQAGVSRRTFHRWLAGLGQAGGGKP